MYILIDITYKSLAAVSVWEGACLMYVERILVFISIHFQYVYRIHIKATDLFTYIYYCSNNWQDYRLEGNYMVLAISTSADKGQRLYINEERLSKRVTLQTIWSTFALDIIKVTFPACQQTLALSSILGFCVFYFTLYYTEEFFCTFCHLLTIFFFSL